MEHFLQGNNPSRVHLLNAKPPLMFIEVNVWALSSCGLFFRRVVVAEIKKEIIFKKPRDRKKNLGEY